MKVNKASAQVGNGEPLWVLAEGETRPAAGHTAPLVTELLQSRLPVPSHLGKAGNVEAPREPWQHPPWGRESSLQGRKAEGAVLP